MGLRPVRRTTGQNKGVNWGEINSQEIAGQSEARIRNFQQGTAPKMTLHATEPRALTELPQSQLLTLLFSLYAI